MNAKLSLDSTPLPRMVRARQWFAEFPRADAEALTRRALGKLPPRIPRGGRVAVAVGSRGIDRLAEIVAAAARALREAGLRPFLVPAMGSHGGGSPEGQRRVLTDYGISEETIGAPLEPSIEVAPAGRTPEGTEVLCSKAALEADGILLINRVKPHTDFAGTLGSGLIKMLTVGLGKPAGARRFHAEAARRGYEATLKAMGEVLLKAAPVWGGLAILEGPRHELLRIEALAPEAFFEREPALCEEARKLMPKLPFEDLDVLVIDRMGKDISGVGMDPSVIGRTIHGYSTIIPPEAPPPRIRRLVVCALSPGSRGNAIGLGMADFAARRLVEGIDREATYLNAFTALSIQGAKIPITLPDDRRAFQAALATLGIEDPRRARAARIRDTLSLETLWISESLIPEAAARGLQVDGPPAPPRFDAEGRFVPIEEGPSPEG